jgi:hypothetical protein
MGRSYRQCTACGKRALSIATRCPACGEELVSPIVREPGRKLELGPLPSPRLMAGVVGTVAVLAAAVLGQSYRAPAKPLLSSVDSAGVPAEVGYSAPGRLDTSIAAGSAVVVAGPHLLVTRTWTHVRNARSRRGDLEAVLLPGDTVLADSLSRGWYRVALEGEVLGYVHQSTLVTPGPRAE